MKRRTTPVALLSSRLPRTADQGAMEMAFMAILIGGVIGGLILSIIITQSRSTHFDATRVHSLHTAESGIDLVLGEIRNSTAPDAFGVTFGDAAGLPCGPVTGSATGIGAGTYTVSILYYVNDPNADPTKSMVCIQGYGPYDTTTRDRTPRYAVLTSTGTDGTSAGGSKGRTLVTTYVFQTDDTNIPGGVIELYPDSSGDNYCMDANSPTPSSGQQVYMQICDTSDPPTDQQVFAYRLDLSIQLLSSVTTANPTGMCLDTNATSHAALPNLVLNPCAISTIALVANPAQCAIVTNCSPWNQQWSVDDNAHLEGALTNKSDIDRYCINATSQSGSPVKVAKCLGGVTDINQTWVPAPTAGTGMAGPGNNQLVNYQKFAACLDVTGQNPNATFLILYTCKQNPAPSKVAWNQKFTPSAVGTGPTKVLLKTTVNGTAYCLTSPLNNGGYVRVTTPCPASVDSALPGYVWTVNTVKNAAGSDLPYAQKYTIVDSSSPKGLCLGSGPNSDLYTLEYSKAVTNTCNGSGGQKWNASPSLDNSKLINTHETP